MQSVFADAALNLVADSNDVRTAGRREVPMKRLIISAFAVVALFFAATTMLRSHSLSTAHIVGATDMPSLQELYATIGVNKLPTEDFEDMSLVYSNVTKR
jgi:hypothetical protein